MKYLSNALLLLVINFSICFSQTKSEIGIINLRCEYLVKPIGIDNPTPRLSWEMDDKREGAWQKAYKIVIGADSLEVAKGTGNIWNSGKIKSDKMMVTIPSDLLLPFTKYYWRIFSWDMNGKMLVSGLSSFETAFMDLAGWKGNWIADGINRDTKFAPYFRKQFELSKKVKSARAYISAGGLYELFINGNKTGDHRLDPAYTRYDRRNLYTSYDVTSQLQNGQNAIGVILGNGWYNHQSTAVWFFHQAPWRNRPAFCFDLRITFQDGSVETISTGTDWKTSTGSIIFNSIYTAEHVDNRLEKHSWNKAGFDDKNWKNAEVRASPSSLVIAQNLHPIRDVERIFPKSVAKINDSTFVYNLGRNISGVSEFNYEGEAGTVFRLKHGERIYENGLVDQSNIDVHYRPTDNNDPFQTDIFILGGNGKEVFRPKFNYKGFQYVEVTCNKPVNLTSENLCGYFMHSDVPQAGRVSSSNKTLEQIWWATNNSYLSNLFGYPTDCPQREKNGWTGDAHIAIETGLYNFDGITIYEKWLADHRDEQQPNGVLPAIIPTSGWGYQWANGPDWTSTIAIIPWNVYLFYGDSKLLADCYENIKRYVDHITDLYPTGLTSWGLGDWVPVSSKPPVEFTSTVYYYVDAIILSRAAQILGKSNDYLKYSALASKIKNAFNAKYFNAEAAVYGAGSQTELSVPLHWDLVPDAMRVKVATNLAKKVAADNYHINVGLLGTKTILNALSENGYADMAYKVASQETFPSWGWWIANGATTLYENWPLDAKSDISLNHIMFGEIGAWMFKALAGIFPDPENPGFKNTILKPNFPDGLQSFEASHRSMFGEIYSGWKKQDGTIHYKVIIPANTTAKLYLPKQYQILNTIFKGKEGLLYLKAGTYSFEIKTK